jgi:hypothetical protein
MAQPRMLLCVFIAVLAAARPAAAQADAAAQPAAVLDNVDVMDLAAAALLGRRSAQTADVWYAASRRLPAAAPIQDKTKAANDDTCVTQKMNDHLITSVRVSWISRTTATRRSASSCARRRSNRSAATGEPAPRC